MARTSDMSSIYEHRRYEALKRLAADRYGAISKDEMAVLKLSSLIDRPEVHDAGARPEVRSHFLRWLLTDASAKGQIDPQGIELNNATVASHLGLNFCKIPLALQFRFCTFNRGVSLQWADLVSLQLFNCTVETGIWADGARIFGDLAVISCRCDSAINLSSARISGDLNFSGTKLTPTGDALVADTAKIAGHVFLTSSSPSRGEEFASTGTVRLNSCEIGGDLECSGAILTSEGNALEVNAAKVGGRVHLGPGFSSVGAIQLTDVEIGGDLDCSGAILRSKDDALMADSAKMRNLYLREGFASAGTIALRGADIHGDFDCQGARQFASLKCDHMRVGQRMIFLDILSPKGADLGLFGASVGVFHDDERSWPERENLELEDFVYQGLVLHERATSDELKQGEFGKILRFEANNRICWLRRQPADALDYAQPWTQLARLLETMGDTPGAKHVLYEFHRQRAGLSIVTPLSFAYDQIQEQPLRIGWPIAFFWALGSLVFWRANRMGAMTRMGSEAINKADDGCAALRASVPFHPIVYALENVLPVVKLGQDSAWAPDPEANTSWLPYWSCLSERLASGRRRKIAEWITRLDYNRLAIFRWTLILVGWALALILAAAIGEQFKH